MVMRLGHSEGKAFQLMDDAGAVDIGNTYYTSLIPALQNFMLAARSLGIGTCLTTLFRVHQDEIRAVCDIPAEYEIEALVPMGTAPGSVRRGAPEPGRNRDVVAELRGVSASGVEPAAAPGACAGSPGQTGLPYPLRTARSRSNMDTSVVATRIHPSASTMASDGHAQPRPLRTIGMPARTK